jgi:RNA polymerase sigma-70 factor (ECF subfamily)
MRGAYASPRHASTGGDAEPRGAKPPRRLPEYFGGEQHGRLGARAPAREKIDRPFVHGARHDRFESSRARAPAASVASMPLAPPDPDDPTASAAAPTGGDWLVRFHRGEREVLESCYREHFDAVAHAVQRVVSGPDHETVVHDVFLRVLTDAEFRARFAGGALRAWLCTVARNRAIDFRRRRDRELPALEDEYTEVDGRASAGAVEDETDARAVVDRFRRDVLPPKWAGVFELRFLEQLDQREAARRLGIGRTTLVYQEMRVRSLLRDFVLGEVAP